jgi:hypothetical protein
LLFGSFSASIQAIYDQLPPYPTSNLTISCGAGSQRETPQSACGSPAKTEDHLHPLPPEFDVLVDIIANSPELQSILLTDAAGQPILSPESRKYWLGMYCDKFIVEYLGVAREVSFKFADYERVYEKLVQFIEQTEPFDVLWLIHIRNLTLEIDKVVLEPGIYLRQATSEEKTNAMRYQSTVPDIPNVFLEIHHSIERRSSPQQQEAANIAEAVVLALRLIKANPVGVASFQWRVLDQPFWLFGRR